MKEYFKTLSSISLNRDVNSFYQIIYVLCKAIVSVYGFWCMLKEGQIYWYYKVYMINGRLKRKADTSFF